MRPSSSTSQPEEQAPEIATYLDRQRRKSLLRFITCGSVDDGKSTLIGRLLYDANTLYEDQLAALQKEAKINGAQGPAVDFARLLDSLAAEREQGITIDVAYRFFSTERRKFIVADTPGHEQYTRNMVTGASTADLAIILVDAHHGVLPQTRRHSWLVHLIGIRGIVLAVNKMDLVDFSPARFAAIAGDYETFAQGIGIKAFTAIPISALRGDNIATRSAHTPWYSGPTLLMHLESAPIHDSRMAEQPFRMAVQSAIRLQPDFRGFAGQITSGVIRPGDAIHVAPSGKTATVKSIVTPDGLLTQAVAGQSITLTLAEEIECSRGTVLAASDAPLEIADQFETTLIWMAEEELLPGRPYLMKLATTMVSASITKIKYEINVSTTEHLAARTLKLNAIGVCNLATDHMIPFQSYTENPDLGAFILIDRVSNATVGAGMIHFALRRSRNIRWQAIDIGREAHAAQKNQRPKLLWFTGLPSSGKSTIANLVEKKLHSLGKHSFLLDGDNLRHGLNRDLGFTDADRVENIRRTAEVAKLMIEAGLIVLAALVSPFRAERRLVRDMLPDGEFIEIFIDTPLRVAEQRDVKGLYKKARAGQLRNFTGIDSPYEPPGSPDIHIRTTEIAPDEAAELIVCEALRG